MQVTEVALVDELASAAELVMGKSSGIPIAIVRKTDEGWFGSGSVRDQIFATLRMTFLMSLPLSFYTNCDCLLLESLFGSTKLKQFNTIPMTNICFQNILQKVRSLKCKISLEFSLESAIRASV